MTEQDVPIATADQEPLVTPDVPPEAPPTADMRPAPDVTTLPVEVAEQYSVEDAWLWATGAEREAFVEQHRSELKKIIAKIERRDHRPERGVIAPFPRYELLKFPFPEFAFSPGENLVIVKQ